jgi:phage-related protein
MMPNGEDVADDEAGKPEHHPRPAASERFTTEVIVPEIFTWTPQKGYSAERTPNVAVVKLGDGYEQRQTKGINTLMDKYSLTFKGVDGAAIGQMRLRRPMLSLSANGREAFYWTPSDTGVQKLFVCRSWSLTKTGPLYELTATFEQVPR